jgi:acetylornithine deacetylase/succinyl-diaminopimelate desuccinylase-like protein
LQRDIILALETDEEILDRDALGIQWLLKNHRNLIDAEFALNEGGPVGLKNGKPIRNSVQTSEKVSVSYQLEVKNRGGHSSLPTKDNAIYHLAEGLVRLSKFTFPFKLNHRSRPPIHPQLLATSGALAISRASPAAISRCSRAKANITSAFSLVLAWSRRTCTVLMVCSKRSPIELMSMAGAVASGVGIW